MTEIEEFAKRFEAVHVFLVWNWRGQAFGRHQRLSNVTVIDLKGEGLSTHVNKPIAFLFYVFGLLPWRRILTSSA